MAGGKNLIEWEFGEVRVAGKVNNFLVHQCCADTLVYETGQAGLLWWAR